MVRTKPSLTELAIFAMFVAVMGFGGGLGYATLAPDDDQDTSALTSPVPHAAKMRAADVSGPAVADIAFTTQSVRPAMWDNILVLGDTSGPIVVACRTYSIRAPPSA